MSELRTDISQALHDYDNLAAPDIASIASRMGLSVQLAADQVRKWNEEAARYGHTPEACLQRIERAIAAERQRIERGRARV